MTDPDSPARNRTVLHVDMDAFYAAVEQHDRPELRGLPVLIGSDRPRSVVSTASYEARPYGCRSAQPMSVAKRLCPAAVIVPPRMARYVEVSEQVFAVFHRVAPAVEPLSIDEAFLDLTGTERLLGPAPEVARDIKRAIHEETGLTASVGLSHNKFLAKFASELEKPDGLTIIGRGDVERILWPLPVERLWGVGPAFAQRLRGRGLCTIGQVAATPLERLVADFGAGGEHVHRLSLGHDDREVVPDGRARSIGQECTFEVDVEEPDEVLHVLYAHVEQVGRRLRRGGVRARTATVKIRYGDFTTVTRSHTLDEPTDATDVLRAAARELWRTWARAGFEPVRLIGFTAMNLVQGAGQLSLFPDPGRQRGRSLDRALDAIRERFGGGSIRRGAQ